MVRKALKGLLGRIGAATGLLAVLGFNTGCPNSSVTITDPERAAGFVGSVATDYKSGTTTGKKSVAYGAISRGLSKEAAIGGNVRAAREGATVINNSVNTQTYTRHASPGEIDYDSIQTLDHPELGQVVLLSCSFFIDRDQDGRIGLDECESIGETYFPDQQIVFYMRTTNPGREFKIEVEDGFGREWQAGGRKEQFLKESLYGRRAETEGTFVVFERGRLPGGNYNASFFYGDELLGELPVRVVEN